MLWFFLLDLISAFIWLCLPVHYYTVYSLNWFSTILRSHQFLFYYKFVHFPIMCIFIAASPQCWKFMLSFCYTYLIQNFMIHFMHSTLYSRSLLCEWGNLFLKIMPILQENTISYSSHPGQMNWHSRQEMNTGRQLSNPLLNLQLYSMNLRFLGRSHFFIDSFILWWACKEFPTRMFQESVDQLSAYF